ncbi:AAA family ATPase [Tumidithrix elongata RA019]|uniref:AAA family ATPase n=1 Tax=Tumidithrix elongata BACA0141 TaxID=2716417 RepID=A0AAW9Q425_9CYAN|nr:AAA family ATPase [Tumidithrix elongata RA019]
MITEVQIENYKSIQKLKLGLGRVTVFIGENGCGKSNILEAIALASAAASNKLDNEFLYSRGIRVTEPEFMRSAFDKENLAKQIKINLKSDEENNFELALQHDNQPYSSWNGILHMPSPPEEFTERIRDQKDGHELLIDLSGDLFVNQKLNLIRNFLIYSPENSSLRIFEKEGQIQPLGINGEGLFKLLKVLRLESV